MSRKTTEKPAKASRTKAAGFPDNSKPKAKMAKRVGKILTRHETFAREWLIDQNGKRAAIAAGYKAEWARSTASELLANPDVQALIAKLQRQRAKRLDIKADDIVSRYWLLANADPREIDEIHRCCCRYCWGRDNLYQFTPRELAEARANWQKLVAESAAEGKPLPREFSDAGGTGWDPRRDPNPKCPECFGEGVERIIIKDTRDLSPGAQLLYAGIKQTKDGLQILKNDPQAALGNVAKLLGYHKSKVELTGKDGGPVKTTSVGAILAELGADGADTGIGPSK